MGSRGGGEQGAISAGFGFEDLMVGAECQDLSWCDVGSYLASLQAGGLMPPGFGTGLFWV